MMGYTRQELVDIGIAEIEAPDSQRSFGDVIENLKDGDLITFEQIHISKDGKRIPVKAYAKLLQYKGEKSVFLKVHDLTQWKKSEEEKEKLQDQLNQARKMEAVGQLAGGVAHDFNNMLAPIIGYAGMLLDDMEPDDPQFESVEEINRAALRAKAVTQQLLAFGRKQALDVKTLDLNWVIGNFKKILRRTIREDISIKLQLDPSLRNIKADAGQLEQVVMNLAVNAQDAMHDGGSFTIRTSNLFVSETFTRQRVAVKSGWYAVLEVSDSGIGMDSQTADRVFEPFFTTKKSGRGTGLGLATVYGIVKQHGGYIWLQSRPGRGTVFEIYLPSVTDPVEEDSIRRDNQTGPPGRETVLIAEDEETVRSMVRQILTRQGYSVLYTGTSEECLRFAEKHDGPIHLLLTDVVMPGINGKELYERLSVTHSDLKVLFMSGYTDPVITMHGIREEGKEFIQKPFTPQALSKKVREVLDGRFE
jgi:signal transduction histidine kinase